MRILLVNNYFHIVGGAETYFLNLAKLLKDKGHDVIFFSMKHPKNFPTEFDKYFVDYLPPLQELTFCKKIKASRRIFYSFEARKKIRQLIIEQKPDIVHINNIWYEITHSIINEIKKFNIPIVMTLHDYRLICPNHKLLVNNKICFSCKKQKYYMVLFKKCFKDSFLKNFIAVLIQYFNDFFLKSYKSIDLFISPSNFLIEIFKENPIFREKQFLHLPYCIDVEEYRPQFTTDEEYIVYFGRLDVEKGVESLIEAVCDLNITLKIIGSGPLENYLRNKVEREKIHNVYFSGFLSKDKVKEEIAKSLFSIAPSIWSENYPYSIIESFSSGKPVVASSIGGIPELVRDNITGLTFAPGDTNSLREKIKYLISDKDKITEMGRNARFWIEQNLNYDKFYNILFNEYNKLIDKRGRARCF